MRTKLENIKCIEDILEREREAEREFCHGGERGGSAYNFTLQIIIYSNNHIKTEIQTGENLNK